MNKRFRVAVVSVLIVLPLVWGVMKRMGARPEASELSVFAQQVDLSPLDHVAVYRDGRVKSYGSFANQMLGFIAGPHKLIGQDDTFTYLDLILRADRYGDADIVHVKQKPMRVQIARVLGGTEGFDDARRARFIKSGLLSPRLLMEPPVSRAAPPLVW